jgi:hypothetical protein
VSKGSRNGDEDGKAAGLFARCSEHDVPRKKGFEVNSGGGLGQFGKESREVPMRLDPIGACRFDQRVQARADAAARMLDQWRLRSRNANPMNII